MGDYWFSQEYDVKFLAGLTQSFTGEAVDMAFTEEVAQ